MLRDQARARHAYMSAASVSVKDQPDYRIAVNAFGAHVIRSGLCAAIAWLQRRNSDAANLFLEHLDTAGIRGLPISAGSPKQGFVARVHSADAAGYMIATRDTLALVMWFRRAVQAVFRSEQEDRG